MWRFPGVTGIVPAASWDSRVATFSTEDQAYLHDVGERYFGVLAFQSEEEQREMVRQGFPMPEEWLAARDLPDAELERLAAEGGSKAKMMHIDRVASRIAPILGAGRGLDVGGSEADRALFHRYVAATDMARDLLHATGSPYAAYLYGYLSSAGTQWNPREPIAGAFLLAHDLGHRRANELRDAFVQQSPGLDAGSVMTSYSSMRRIAP